MPLDAKLIMEKVASANGNKEDEESPFAQDVMIGEHDVKKLGKPFTADHVRELVEKGKAVDREKISEEFSKWLSEKLGKIKDEDARDAAEKRESYNFEIFRHLTENVNPGLGVGITDKKTGEYTYGLITNITRKGKTKNPAALSDWIVEFALASPAKRMTASFSQIANEKAQFAFERKPADIFYRELENGRNESRETAVVLTGNLLGALELLKYESGKKIMFFETADGDHTRNTAE